MFRQLQPIGDSHAIMNALGGCGCAGLVMMPGDKCIKNVHHIRTRMKI